MKETFTKDEMFKYINDKVKKNKISDDILGYFLFIEDNKLGGTCSIGQCSELFLFDFLAKGIINLARYKNITVLQTAIDVLHLACELDEAEQQNKKEQEGA